LNIVTAYLATGCKLGAVVRDSVSRPQASLQLIRVGKLLRKSLKSPKFWFLKVLYTVPYLYLFLFYTDYM